MTQNRRVVSSLSVFSKADNVSPVPGRIVCDLRDIPDNVKNGLELIPVSNVMEVLRTALTRMPEPIEWDEAAEAAKAAAVVPPAGEGPSAPAH